MTTLFTIVWAYQFPLFTYLRESYQPWNVPFVSSEQTSVHNSPRHCISRYNKSVQIIMSCYCYNAHHEGFGGYIKLWEIDEKVKWMVTQFIKRFNFKLENLAIPVGEN